MKKIFSIIVFTWFSILSFSQVNQDSLWNVWTNENLEDSFRLQALNKYASYKSQFGNLDSAHNAVMLLHDVAINIGDKFYQAKSYEELGLIHWRKPNFAEAQKHFVDATNIFEEINKKQEAAGTLWNLGVVYLHMNQYAKALEYHLKSQVYYEDLDLSSSGILNNIGLIYENLNDDNTALEYYTKSVEAAEKYGDHNSNASSNIADIHLKRGDHVKALDMYNEILKGIEKDKKGNYYDLKMSQVLRNIANVNAELENYDLALKNYLLSLEFQHKDSISLGQKQGEITVGMFYNRIEKYTSAIKYCSIGLKKAKEGNSIKYQALACQCLYMAYKNQGAETEALNYYENYHKLNDSLRIEESIKNIQEIEFAKMMLTDSLKQEEEKLQLELIHEIEMRKKNNQRNIFLSSGLFAFLIAFGLWNRLKYTRKSKSIIEKEKDRSENLLLNILPFEIAEELKSKGQSSPRDFEQVTILFTDFKEFTQTSEKLSAKELVSEINTCFETFDGICEKYQIEKIKTIGDAYMAAGGLPVLSPDSVKNTVLAAIDMQIFIEQRKSENDISGQMAFEMRAGINSGPVVAGIVGIKKFQYDIWGDTVNIASRMESHAEVGTVNISQSTYELLKNDPDFIFESRGKIQAKGKGEVEMYFVSRA